MIQIITIIISAVERSLLDIGVRQKPPVLSARIYREYLVLTMLSVQLIERRLILLLWLTGFIFFCYLDLISINRSYLYLSILDRSF